MDFSQKPVGEFIGNVQAPSTGASSNPPANHAVFTANEIPKRIARLVHVRQVVNTPPAGIRSVFRQREPIGIGRTFTLTSTHVGIIAIAIKVARISPGVIKNAIQNNGDATRLGLATQHLKRFFITQNRIYREIIGSIVAMVACGLKNRI